MWKKCLKFTERNVNSERKEMIILDECNWIFSFQLNVCFSLNRYRIDFPLIDPFCLAEKNVKDNQIWKNWLLSSHKDRTKKTDIDLNRKENEENLFILMMRRYLMGINNDFFFFKSKEKFINFFCMCYSNEIHIFFIERFKKERKKERKQNLQYNAQDLLLLTVILLKWLVWSWKLNQLFQI